MKRHKKELWMEQDYKFSKAELADFKRFWEGDIGKKYIDKMKRTKDQLLEAAMGSADRDGSAYYAHIANGVDSIVKDIDALIKATEEKKEAKAKGTK